jgi:hypothetical protein
MGGTQRSKEKPRPSYEDGKLRDPKVEAMADAASSDWKKLIRRAVPAAQQRTDERTP